MESILCLRQIGLYLGYRKTFRRVCLSHLWKSPIHLVTKAPAAYSWKLAFELSECEQSGGLRSKSEVCHAGLILLGVVCGGEPGWSPQVQEQLLEALAACCLCLLGSLKFYAFK